MIVTVLGSLIKSSLSRSPVDVGHLNRTTLNIVFTFDLSFSEILFRKFHRSLFDTCLKVFNLFCYHPNTLNCNKLENIVPKFGTRNYTTIKTCFVTCSIIFTFKSYINQTQLTIIITNLREIFNCKPDEASRRWWMKYFLNSSDSSNGSRYNQ